MADGLPAFFYCVERDWFIVAVHTDALEAARDADSRSERTGEAHAVIARTNAELVPALNDVLAKNEREHFASPPILKVSDA